MDELQDLPPEKTIRFQNQKLIYDGQEVSIEKARRILKEQVRELEDSVTNSINENPALDREALEILSDFTNRARIDAANAGVHLRGLDDLMLAGKNIMEAFNFSNDILDSLDESKKDIKEIARKSPNKPVEKIDFDWPGNVNNDPDYVPTYKELYDKFYELGFQSLIYQELKKQFRKTPLRVIREDIKVDSDYIKQNFFFDIAVNDGKHITFQIALNHEKYGNLPGTYIAAGLRIGSIKIQNTLEEYLKYGNNNYKSARTFDNLVTKQIRLLKTTIRQEINYSLDKSLASVAERLRIAELYTEEYNFLLDKISRINLERIVADTKKILSRRKEEDIIRKNFVVPDFIEMEVEDKEVINLEEILKKECILVFSITPEKLKYQVKEKDKIFEFLATVEGQKIQLMVINQEIVSVSSIYTTGGGKKDYRANNIEGENLPMRLRRAVIMASYPKFKRQLDSLLNSLKGSQKKHIFQRIAEPLKRSYELIEGSDKTLLENYQVCGDLIKQSLEYYQETISEAFTSYFEVIDLLLKAFYDIFAKKFEQEYEINLIDYDNQKAVLAIYKDSAEFGDNLVESIEVIKKFIYRNIQSNILIDKVAHFCQLDFTQNLDKMEKEEVLIKKLADDLSEDIKLGGITRKILVLMDSSISSRDDLFKNNLKELIEDIISSRW